MKAKPFLSTLILYSFLLFVFHLIRFPLFHPSPSIITLFIPSGEAAAYQGGGEGEGEIPESKGDYALPLPPVKKEKGKIKRPLPPLPGMKGEGKKKGYEITGPLAKRRLIRLVLPEYPEREMGRSVVRIRIVVDKNGIVKKLELVKTGGAAFDRAAMEAIREWRFEPSREEKDVEGVVTIFFEVR